MTAKMMDGDEELAALQLEHGDAVIYLPPAVSLAGDYAKIAEPALLSFGSGGHVSTASLAGRRN